MKTIIVDDERWLLEQFECECANIHDINLVGKFEYSQDALDFARSHQIDLAFLDIKMPVIDGLTLSTMLRKLYPKIIIIFVSSYDQYMPDAFQNHGADYFLVKPYRRKELEATIERAKLLSGRLKRTISIRTFGQFTMYFNNVPVVFKTEKSKELMAFFVDNRGRMVRPEAACAALWPEEDPEKGMCHIAVAQLQETFDENKMPFIIKMTENGGYIDSEKADSDLGMFLDGNTKAIRLFDGEYMTGYAWAEKTRESLKRQKILFEKHCDKTIRDSLCAVVSVGADDALSINYINSGFIAITGFTRFEIAEKFHNSFKELIIAEDYEKGMRIAKKQLEKDNFIEIEFRVKCRNDRTLWVLCRGELYDASIEENQSIMRIDCMLVDISAYKTEQIGSNRDDKYDALTQLLTRNAFYDITEKKIAEHSDKICAMLLLDIDNFNYVNKTYGRQFADTVITDISAIVKRSFRDDDIKGRVGGDQLAVYLVDFPDIKLLKEKIDIFHASVKRRLTAKTKKKEISCSIGVSLCCDQSMNYDNLCSQAETALRYAKNSGKDRLVFIPDINDNKIVYNSSNVYVSPQPSKENEFTEYLKLLLDHTKQFLETIDAVIGIIGRNSDTSRVYILENSDDGKHVINTFEWCAKDVRHNIRNLQQLSGDDFIAYYDLIEKNNGIYGIYDVETSDAVICGLLENKDVKSMIHATLKDENGKCIGIMGFDACYNKQYWSDDQQSLLKSSAKIIGKALAGYRHENGSDYESLHKRAIERK